MFFLQAENREKLFVLLSFMLAQNGVQHLGAQAVQQQAITGSRCRQRHERMLVVQKTEILIIAEQARYVETYRFVELQRI